MGGKGFTQRFPTPGLLLTGYVSWPLAGRTSLGREEGTAQTTNGSWQAGLAGVRTGVERKTMFGELTVVNRGTTCFGVSFERSKGVVCTGRCSNGEQDGKVELAGPSASV